MSLTNMLAEIFMSSNRQRTRFHITSVAEVIIIILYYHASNSSSVYLLQIVEVEQPFDRVKNQRRAFIFITYESEEIVEQVVANPKQIVGGKEVRANSLRGGVLSVYTCRFCRDFYRC